MNQPTLSAPRSRRRILLVASLGVGTLASVILMVAAQGAPVLSWIALVVALLAGFLATWAALIEFREWREQAIADASIARKRERDRIQELHVSQRRVLVAVHARVRQLGGELTAAKISLEKTESTLAATQAAFGEAQHDLSCLRGAHEALRIENDGLRAVGEELWAENRTLRAQPVADDAGDETTNVLSLPRRRAIPDAGTRGVARPSAVVDLDLQRLTAPFVNELRERHAN